MGNNMNDRQMAYNIILVIHTYSGHISIFNITMQRQNNQIIKKYLIVGGFEYIAPVMSCPCTREFTWANIAHLQSHSMILDTSLQHHKEHLHQP